MNKVYEIVQQRIIEDIQKAIEEGGCAPWHKPWKHQNKPKNFITKKPYRGVNLLLLNEGGYYLTFNQIRDLQKKYDFLKLKKGSKGDIVVFWKFDNDSSNDTSNETELLEESVVKEKKAPLFKYYKVFNQSYIEGFEKLLSEEDFGYEHEELEISKDAEEIIKKYNDIVNIEFKKIDKAFYSPALDKINMPDKSSFKFLDDFYSTCFHEIIHSTGNESRLNRLAKNFKFGDHDYSKEELVAEIGAAMMCSECNINNQDLTKNSNAYLYSWLSALKKDVNILISASQQAQKACDYVFDTIKI